MRTIVVWAALTLAASSARAQDRSDAGQEGQQRGANEDASQRGTGTGNAPSTGATSDAFDRACIDLLHGRMPPDERGIQALKDACSRLMSGRADDRLDAERRRREQLQAQEQLRAIAEGRVQAGQSAAQPQPGQGVLAAFGEAASELTGRRQKGMGMTRRGAASYTFFTNPVGWFTGLGVNAQLFHPFEDAPKFSWVAGARYSATDATNGTATTFGGMGGADWFVIGRNNEGLRVGPRVELAAGRERFGGGSSTTFARLGMSGELGYNFLATNGISGTAAIGVGGRVAGDSKNESFSSFVGGEFGPYLSVGLGYSW